MGGIRNQEGQGKLSPGASVSLSPLSPTLAYTVASISRNQECKGNRIGKGRPRVGQSLVRRGSHLILLQGETIKMLKGRKEKERRERLERKGRDAIKGRGRTILDGGFGSSAFWLSSTAHFVGSLSTEDRIRGVPNPRFFLYSPLISLPTLTPISSFCQFFLLLPPPNTAISLPAPSIPQCSHAHLVHRPCRNPVIGCPGRSAVPLDSAHICCAVHVWLP